MTPVDLERQTVLMHSSSLCRHPQPADEIRFCACFWCLSPAPAFLAYWLSKTFYKPGGGLAAVFSHTRRTLFPRSVNRHPRMRSLKSGVNVNERMITQHILDSTSRLYVTTPENTDSMRISSWCERAVPPSPVLLEYRASSGRWQSWRSS